MAKAKLFYIGTRYNPQFNKPYYVAFGRLSKTEASRKEQCTYGSMFVNSYGTQEEYDAEIERLLAAGYSVHRRG